MTCFFPFLDIRHAIFNNHHIMSTHASTTAAFSVVPSASSFTSPLPHSQFIFSHSRPCLEPMSGFSGILNRPQNVEAPQKAFGGVPEIPIRLQNVRAPQRFIAEEDRESDEGLISREGIILSTRPAVLISIVPTRVITAPASSVLIKNDQYLLVNTSRQMEPLHRYRRVPESEDPENCQKPERGLQNSLRLNL